MIDGFQCVSIVLFCITLIIVLWGENQYYCLFYIFILVFKRFIYIFEMYTMIILFVYIYLHTWNVYSDREKERQAEIFFLLVHSPNACNNEAGRGESQELRTSSGYYVIYSDQSTWTVICFLLGVQ